MVIIKLFNIHKWVLSSFLFIIFFVNGISVNAVPLPGINPFVMNHTAIKQPANSKWCVRACTDVALNYLQVLQNNGTIGPGNGQIQPGSIAAGGPQTPANLAITMAFHQIDVEIRQFSNNHPQIICTRRAIIPSRPVQQAYNEIHNALNSANGQAGGGIRPGIAILHFEGPNVDHACITYGVNADNIEVYDPMPGRQVFNCTNNAFRYLVRGVPRNLSEYWLIQW
ncbi:MAG: hypothetical protein LBF32_03390 [Streptococcaceae bacterium]|jgi:hypothetical protein|nr:hypothetical protein [Streptococcaceae bacterium]